MEGIAGTKAPFLPEGGLVMLFENRRAAGRELARRLNGYKDGTDTVVLALPRGGVPVAFEVARQLPAPLDVFLVRKLGVPGRSELAMGAIASGGGPGFDPLVVFALDGCCSHIQAVREEERIC